jgi:hypothetical protein
LTRAESTLCDDSQDTSKEEPEGVQDHCHQNSKGDLENQEQLDQEEVPEQQTSDLEDQNPNSDTKLKGGYNLRWNVQAPKGCM